MEWNLWFYLWFKSFQLAAIVTFPFVKLMYHLKFFISVFSWTVQQMWCVYSCVVMSFSHLFLSILFSALSGFLWCRARWGLWGGGADWKCVCVCVCVCVWVSEWILTLRVGGGWWPLTLSTVCVCGVAPTPRHLSLGLNPTLNRTSSVFHCGAFPHASFSMYDSLSNQREGDASVSDLIKPGCPRSAFQMLPLLKKQNS